MIDLFTKIFDCPKFGDKDSDFCPKKEDSHPNFYQNFCPRQNNWHCAKPFGSEDI